MAMERRKKNGGGHASALPDTLFGNAGKDDITDFANTAGNNDTFQLENAGMAGLGAAGALNGNAFFAGAAAHVADDRIIYNKANGALTYDSNGNLAGGATLLAVLQNKPADIAANDFAVI